MRPTVILKTVFLEPARVVLLGFWMVGLRVGERITLWIGLTGLRTLGWSAGCFEVLDISAHEINPLEGHDGGHSFSTLLRLLTTREKKQSRNNEKLDVHGSNPQSMNEIPLSTPSGFRPHLY